MLLIKVLNRQKNVKCNDYLYDSSKIMTIIISKIVVFITVKSIDNQDVIKNLHS